MNLAPLLLAFVAQEPLAWEELAPLPDEHGFAGSFAGATGGALIVAGGANFPDDAPWRGGAKAWHDRIFVLEGGSWRELDARLPKPLAYGVSVSWKDALVCAGGGDAVAHSDRVFLLRSREGGLETEELPSLPRPTAFGSGALLGDTLYVVGGIDRPDARAATRDVFALDLSSPKAWRELPPWDGPGRMLAVVGAQDGSLFLFGGVALVEGERDYLTDAHRYTPGEGWTRVADLPRPAAAAPSPAPALGQSHLLVLGGDTGELAGSDLRDEHPGFARGVLAYHTVTDTWRRAGELPEAPPVTAAAVAHGDGWIVPSGEVRPGARTPRVLRMSLGNETRPFGVPDYTVLALYFAALVGMGFYFSRRERSTEDFFLGGRRVPWWAAGLSIYGTQLSAITFMAIPAKSFATDWVFSLGHATILMAAPVVVGFYLPHFRRLKVASAYEYLELRFNRAVRLLGSGSYLLFQLGRMGIVLFLPALALSAVTGIDVNLCILVMGVLATVYATLGGIEAVIWTDVLQVVVLLGGALLSLAIIFLRVEPGAFEATVDAGKLHLADLDWSVASAGLWVVIVGNFFFSLVSYTSDQSVIQRYMTTADEKEAARSVWTNGLMAIPSAAIFFGLGTALWAFYRSHPERLSLGGRTDDVFPWFIAGEMPAGVSGLVIAGLFAAAMSSLDSSMNSMATAVTTDFYPLARPRSGDRERLRVARALTALFGVGGTGSALYLASLNSTSMFDQYLKVIGLFGGGLAALFAAGIFTRRANGPGVLIGFVTSAAVLWLVQRSGAVHFLLYAAVGVTTCFGVGLAASFAFRPRERG